MNDFINNTYQGTEIIKIKVGNYMDRREKFKSNDFIIRAFSKIDSATTCNLDLYNVP